MLAKITTAQNQKIKTPRKPLKAVTGPSVKACTADLLHVAAINGLANIQAVGKSRVAISNYHLVLSHTEMKIKKTGVRVKNGNL